MPINLKKVKYDVISPDGFSIHFSDTYPSKKKAMEAFEKWKERYNTQGYYSSMNYGRIPIPELKNYIKVIQL
jgi:hypothetical protein